jgi:hypothetical protein
MSQQRVAPVVPHGPDTVTIMRPASAARRRIPLTNEQISELRTAQDTSPQALATLVNKYLNDMGYPLSQIAVPLGTNYGLLRTLLARHGYETPSGVPCVLPSRVEYAFPTPALTWGEIADYQARGLLPFDSNGDLALTTGTARILAELPSQAPNEDLADLVLPVGLEAVRGRDGQPLLRVHQLAALLNVFDPTVRAWVKAGYLTPVIPGWYAWEDALEAMRAAGGPRRHTQRNATTGPISRAPSRPLTLEEDATLRELHAEAPTKPPWTDDRRDKRDKRDALVSQLHHEGVSYTTLANTMGVSVPGVRVMVRRGTAAVGDSVSQPELVVKPVVKKSSPFTDEHRALLREADRNVPRTTQGRRQWSTPGGESLDETLSALYVNTDVTMEELATELGATRELIRQRLSRTTQHRAIIDDERALLQSLAADLPSVIRLHDLTHPSIRQLTELVRDLRLRRVSRSQIAHACQRTPAEIARLENIVV